jgi:hypothetical protein
MREEEEEGIVLSYGNYDCEEWQVYTYKKSKRHDVTT